MIAPTRRRRDLTDVEREYLRALADGERKGKDMRERLREYGVYEDRMKFYRVMQWLKHTGHVEAERIARDEGEYRGSQCIYTLTAAGKVEIGLPLECGEPQETACSDAECREQIERGRLCLV